MLWCDGRLVDGTTVPFDLSDRGLLLGDGVFDTALAIDGRIAFEAAHVARLVASAEALGFAVAPERILEAMRAVAGQGGHVAIRTTVTRGPGLRGIAPPADPRPFLFARGTPARRELQGAPVRLTRASIRRNATSPTARLKTLAYLDTVLATREAVARGFDDVVFLNTDGNVACCGAGNILIFDGTIIVTPPLSDGVLPGITRNEIFHIAEEGGIGLVERSIPSDGLDAAEAIILTNSLRLLAPVVALDERRLDSAIHPIFAHLNMGLRRRVAASCGLDAEAAW